MVSLHPHHFLHCQPQELSEADLMGEVLSSECEFLGCLKALQQLPAFSLTLCHSQSSSQRSQRQQRTLGGA